MSTPTRTALRVWLSRLADHVWRRRHDHDLGDEIEAHVDLLATEWIARGLSPADARAAARREFGAVEPMKERYRDQRGFPLVSALGQDIRFGARLLVKDRGFTATAVLALALGLGITNTVFTLVNAILLRGLPTDPDHRVMYLATADAAGRRAGVSYLDYEDWRRATRAFGDFAAFMDTAMGIGEPSGAGTRAPERVRGTYVSAQVFRIVGQPPMLGRDFVADDDRPGASPVVILGHGVWVDRYGSDPGIIGRGILVNGAASTVVGVMPAGFRFPYASDAWQPLASMPGLSAQTRDRRTLSVIGRVAEGVTLEQARADIATISSRIAADHPETNADRRTTVITFNAHYNDGFGGQLHASMGAVAFVLLIACVNVANLLLARAAHRSREISIRRALGATRWRLVRQLLIESMMLAAFAGLVGLAFSAIGMRVFAAAVRDMPAPYWVQWSMDTRVFGFLAAVCLATTVVFGLAPALHVSKASVTGTLKDGGRTGTAGIRTRRWASALVCAEVALALMLLTGAGLMMRSFLALYRADRVIDPGPLVAMHLTLSPRYASAEQRLLFYEQIEERLAAVPTIAGSTIANMVPFGPGRRQPIAIEGREPTSGGGAADRPLEVATIAIGDRYFHTIDLPLIRGRAFTRTDGTPGHEAAIVNQHFAAMHFPNGDAIGRRIRLGAANSGGGRPAAGPGSDGTGSGRPAAGAASAARPGADRPEAPPWLTIVGVSPTVRQSFGAPGPVVYVPARAQPEPSAYLLVRSQSDVRAVASTLRTEIRALDPELPAFDVLPMTNGLKQMRFVPGLFSTLFTIFASIALALSTVGLYAVTAYAARQRTQEIGVRVALGARGPQVCWLILRRALTQVAIGSALGFAGALVIGRLLQGFLIQTTATDPLTLVSVVALQVAVCAAASLWPAWRATRLDPVAALRHE